MYFNDSGLNTGNECVKNSKDSQPTTCLLLNQRKKGELGTLIGTVLIKNRPKTDPKGGRALN